MTNKIDKSNDLTGKQQTFVAAYLSNGFNATRAAVEAGYAPDSAHVEGCRLLRNAKVAGAIARTFQDKGIAPETVQILLGSVAFDADITDFEAWIKGEKTLEQLRAEGVDTRAVKTATDSPKGRRIELHDRLAALKELGRILGLVTSKYEITKKLRSESDLKNMTDEELERLAFTLAPQPEGLQYLTEEELKVWAAEIDKELCRRRENHQVKSA